MNKATFIKSNSAIYVLWIISFIVVLSLFIYFYIMIAALKGSNVSGNVTSSSGSLIRNLSPIDEEISTTLSYEKYINLKDSINNVRFIKNGRLNSGVYSPFDGAMSMQFAMNKDIVHKSRFDQFSIKSPDSYFYVMRGWKIKFNSNSTWGDNTYYVENGVPYFRKYVLKSTKGTHSNWEMKEDRLKYYCDSDNKTILIPISKNVYSLAKFTSLAIMFIFALVYFTCAFMAFKILYNISKGKVFIEQNIKMLRQASFIMILTPLLFTLIILSQRLIFCGYFDDNIVMNMEIFESNGQLLLYGIAVSILYSVFKRGFNIQQENDLVV